MIQIVSIIIAALLSENYVLVKFLGICPFLGVSKRINAALGMGIAISRQLFAARVVVRVVQAQDTLAAAVQQGQGCLGLRTLIVALDAVYILIRERAVKQHHGNIPGCIADVIVVRRIVLDKGGAHEYNAVHMA